MLLRRTGNPLPSLVKGGSAGENINTTESLNEQEGTAEYAKETDPVLRSCFSWPIKISTCRTKKFRFLATIIDVAAEIFICASLQAHPSIHPSICPLSLFPLFFEIAFLSVWGVLQIMGKFDDGGGLTTTSPGLIQIQTFSN